MNALALSHAMVKKLPMLRPISEPFCDLQELAEVLQVPVGFIHRALNFRSAQGIHQGKDAALNAPRLAAKQYFQKPVVSYSDAVRWLLVAAKGIETSTAEGIAREACYRTSRQGLRKLGKRTNTGQGAFTAYQKKWPKADQGAKTEPAP